MNNNQLQDFVNQILNFYELTYSDQIIIIGYYLQEREQHEIFTSSIIGEYFGLLALQPPKNFDDLMRKLVKTGRLVLYGGGYVISGVEKKNLEQNFFGDAPLISLKDELKNLPSKMSEPTQSKFVNEILGCLQVKSWRASIILTWILTLNHLQKYILANKLELFNEILHENEIYKKIIITKLNDFEQIKDVDFLRIIRTCGIIGSSQLKILEQRLDMRNSYAHPTDLDLTDTMTISFIEDLLHNIIFKVVKEPDS